MSVDSDDWSVLEKNELLKVLEECGSENLDVIFLKLPFKSVNQISKMIQLYRDMANCILAKDIRFSMTQGKVISEKKSLGPNYKTPIDEWCASLSSTASSKINGSELSEAFRIISIYEPHPHPSQMKGIDFRSLYMTLACILNGKPPPHLNTESFNFLCTTAKSLANFVFFNTTNKQQSKLNSFRHVVLRQMEILPKTAQNNNRILALYKLRNKKDYNPIDIPVNMLKSNEQMSFLQVN